MTAPQSFGEWLRHRRRELDLTQDALARQVGCARVTIRKLEADEMRPSKQLAELLAEQLGVPPDERETFVRFGRSGMPAGFAATTPRHNLPINPSSFIGRERELAAVKQALHSSRLVTLTGSGGIGKTRLALQAAGELIDTYQDGVWWVELAALRDPALVVQAIAKVRDVREIPNQPLVETLAAALRAQQMLLVLDNCEHLISACAQLVDRLLSACQDLKMVATSREALDIVGETIWPVPSLSLPELHGALPAHALSKFESIHLFADRATSVQPGFELTDHNALAVVQICRRLSGIPLAIELAAARVKMMSVDEIARRLDDRFDLLTAGSRTALPRHQTLRATIDWSYDLLTEPEQMLFRRLSVFAGGFTFGAAEAVAVGGDVSKSQVIDLLGQLISKSLVTVEARSGDPGSETRYGMLETIREYARKRLEDAGEMGQIRDRHLAYYVRLGAEAEPELFSLRHMYWIRWLEAEMDNIRAALERSTDGDAGESLQRAESRLDTGLRLAGSLIWGLERAYRSEAYERIKYMLSRTDLAKPTQGRAIALTAIGFVAWVLSNFEEGRAYLEEASSILRRLDDKPSLAWTLVFLAATAIAQSDYVGAKAFVEEALAIARELGLKGKAVMGVGLGFGGDIPWYEGDYARAEEMYEQSIILLTELGEVNFRARQVRQLGYLALRHGDYSDARDMFTKSLQANLEVGHQVGPLACLAALAALAVGQKDYRRAALLFGMVEAQLEVIKVHLIPSDETIYRHYLAVLQAELETPAYATAYAEGRTLSLEQALEFALRA